MMSIDLSLIAFPFQEVAFTFGFIKHTEGSGWQQNVLGYTLFATPSDSRNACVKSINVVIP